MMKAIPDVENVHLLIELKLNINYLKRPDYP